MPLAPKLRGIVGDRHVLTGVGCSPYVLEGRTPEAVVFPTTRDEVSAVLVAAGEASVPVTPWGGGTRIAVGAPPSRAGIVLALKRFDKMREHEPADLTCTVEAGMTMAALQNALATRGQWLSLDPPHADRATVGGILASNASGPRRHLYGTGRDLLIGLTMVLADGSVVRGGGKVVKNVAGYDLPKLAIGSFGTLGVIVEATVKLRPRPDVDHLVVTRFASLAEAGAAVRAIMASDLIPSAIDLADQDALRAAGLEGDGAGLLVGFDGVPDQVAWQEAELARLIGVQGTVLDGTARDEAWKRRGELERSAFEHPTAVMTWGVLPSQAADVMAQAREAAVKRGLRCALAAHAGVGIITAVLGDGADAAAVVAAIEDWRRVVEVRGGHARLDSAPLAVKERVPIWDPPGPAHRIMKRLKDELDPRGILNPGRFVGGI